MLRKDLRKSSYYVWSLGTEVAKGLIGPDVMENTLRSLFLRVSEETSFDPVKVTLQVSHKGVKVLHSMAYRRSSKTEIKEFVPRDAIMYVQQSQDVVAFVVFLFESEKQWPLQMHAFRCDSVETAHNLTNQLHVLISRPGHQQKVADIEAQLQAQCVLQSQAQCAALSLLSCTTSSESSGCSSSGDIASLYSSLAAELQRKLTVDSKEPLLLPPKDYDTISRQRGNVAAAGLWYDTVRDDSSRDSSRENSGHTASPSKSDQDCKQSVGDDPLLNAFLRKKPSTFSQTNSEIDAKIPREYSVYEFNEVCPENSPANMCHNRTAVEHQRTPSPSSLAAGKTKSAHVVEHISSHDRFKDAKEKFLLLEKEYLSAKEKEIGPNKIILQGQTPMLPFVKTGAVPCKGYLQVNKNDTRCSNQEVPEELFHKSNETIDCCSSHKGVRHKKNGKFFQNTNKFIVLSHCEEISPHHFVCAEKTENSYKKNANAMKDFNDLKYEHSRSGYQLSELSAENCQQFPNRMEKMIDLHDNQPVSIICNEANSKKFLHIPKRPTVNVSSQKPKSASAIDYSYLNGQQQAEISRVPGSEFHISQYEAYKNSELITKTTPTFGSVHKDHRRDSNELSKEYKRKYHHLSGSIEQSVGENKQLHVPSFFANKRHNSSYQELSDHERFPGLDRETARISHHNNIVTSPADSIISQCHHSYSETGFHKSNENLQSLPHHQQIQRRESSASSNRVGIAAVHRF